MRPSHLTEGAAYPFLSVPQVDVHSPPAVILKGGSNSYVSEAITVQICNTGDAGAKSPHGRDTHIQLTLKLHLLENKQTNNKQVDRT